MDTSVETVDVLTRFFFQFVHSLEEFAPLQESCYEEVSKNQMMDELNITAKDKTIIQVGC